MTRILFAVLLMTLAGCATKPIAPNLATNAPAERVMAHQVPIAGGGTVTVVRDKGFLGSGCYLGVFVNGDLAAKLSRAERVKLYLPMGRTLLASRSVGGGLCENDSNGRSVAVQITPGDSFTYRLALSQDGVVSLMPLD